MPALAVSSDGGNIYVALEDDSGLPLVLRASTSQLEDWTVAYEPGDGTAVNVAQSPENPDTMFFYGNFGSDIGVIQHDVSGNSNSDISPASLGANVVNALDVCPDNEAIIYIGVNGSQDLLITRNGGGGWTTQNSALGLDPTVIKVAWVPTNILRLFIAGNNGSDTVLYWSVDGGVTLTDQAGTDLGNAANISGIDLLV